ncbi:MAG TPA: hypothetical protein VF576_11555, partial [Rubricoccaceae bacterium]
MSGDHAPRFTAAYDGHDGEHELTVFALGYVGDPEPLDVLELPDEECADPSPGFGGGPLGREQAVTFSDPDGALSAVLDAAETERAVYLRVTGPDGLGGTYTFEGTPVPEDDDESAAPLVFPGRARSVRFRCGLAAADEAVPLSASVLSAAAVAGLADVSPRDVVLDWGVFPEVGAGVGRAPDRDAYRLIHAGLWAPEDSVGDRVAAAAALHSLAVYQSARDLDADGSPRWHARPRATQGLALTTATLTPYGAARTQEGSAYPHAVAAQGHTFDGDRAWGGTRDDRLQRRAAPSVVRLVSEAPYNLTRDPELAAFASGDDEFWSLGIGTTATASDTIRPHAVLAAGSLSDVLVQDVGALAAGSALRFVTARSFLFGEGVAEGTVRVRLRKADGTFLWWTGAAWSGAAGPAGAVVDEEATTAYREETGGDPDAGGSTFALVSYAQTGPLPEGGALTVYVL